MGWIKEKPMQINYKIEFNAAIRKKVMIWKTYLKDLK